MGLKIRVVGSPLFIDTYRALGANLINMNFGEALQAFQQGTVEGGGRYLGGCSARLAVTST